MEISDAISLLEHYGYLVETIDDVETQILLLKKQMYKLEDEAERLQIKARSASRTSLFSHTKVYLEDEDLASQARKKRMEARDIARHIHDLQKELK